MTQELILQDNRAVVAGNLNNWLDRFFMFIDVKAKSADTYKKATKQFMKYLAENGITEPTRETVISWREYLRAEHKPTTIQLYLTAIKLFFTWLEQEGLYKNIANKVKGVKIQKGHKKDSLTSNQSKEVLSDIDTTTAKGKRDFAIVALLLTTGLRTIEIVRADVADLRTVGDSTVLFIQGKGRDEKSEYVCGHCDLCIERKKLQNHTAKDVEDGILYMTALKPRTIQEIYSTLSFSKPEISQTISMLVEEGIIIHNEDDTYSNPKPLD